jgi:solute carrier family 35 protein F1/2
LCLVGNVVVIYSDVRSSDSSNALLGDFLCIGGAILYSLSNVGSEKYIKQFNQIEYLTYLGFWGTFISLIQILILERTEISNLNLTYDSILFLIGFSLCMFALYSIVPMTLTYGGATLYNLSLLTSDIYAVLSSIIIFHNFPNYLFYVSLVFVMGGLLVYSLKNDVNIEIINEDDKENETTEFIHHIEVRNEIEESIHGNLTERNEIEEESNLLETK